MLGIPGVSLREQCQTFWNLFQYEEPDHIVYQSGKDLSRCLPLNLYGDEGRGPKRAQYLEMSKQLSESCPIQITRVGALQNFNGCQAVLNQDLACAVVIQEAVLGNFRQT